MNLKEPTHRFLSKFDHKGTCHRCEISWKYRDHMQGIEYLNGSACFPLCQQCFDSVTARAATGYFIEWWDEHDVGDKYGNGMVDVATQTFHLNARIAKEGASALEEFTDYDGRIGRVVESCSDGRVRIDLRGSERAVWIPRDDEHIQVVIEELHGWGEPHAVLTTEDGDSE